MKHIYKWVCVHVHMYKYTQNVKWWYLLNYTRNITARPYARPLFANKAFMETTIIQNLCSTFNL